MKLLRILYIQVIIGICAGIIVGIYFPRFADTGRLISEAFVNLIRMLIAPVIFLTVVLGISSTGDLKKLGRVGVKGLVYFEAVTSLALVIGLVVANIARPGEGIPPQHLPAAEAGKYTGAHMNWSDFIVNLVPRSIMEAFAQSEIIQILVFAIIFSIGLQHTGKPGQQLLSFFDRVSQVLFRMLKMVMRLSPFGAFGGMAFTIGKYGITVLAVLGKLIGCFYLTALLFIFIVLQLILRFYGFSLWKLLGYIRSEILIVFGASSSEAVLPNLMQKLQAAGCAKSVVALIVPTGYSFNLDGTTIYLSMCVVALAQVFHVPLSLSQQLAIIGILIITSKGAAGVTGSGFLVLASTLTAMKVVPVEGLGLLIGIDRFMSEARAITNMIGNTVATVVIARSENAIDLPTYRSVVEGVKPIAVS